MSARPSVFHYLDYRAFLRDYYGSEKARNPRFSHRSFSRRIGVRSPSHLKRVIDGERCLTDEMASRYAEVIGLRSDEAKYFRELVRFNDASSSKDKEAAYQSLSAFRQYRQAHRLTVRHAEYCAHWYIPAVRELAARDDFLPDPQWIADTLRPPITAKQAKSALKVLFELGFLVPDAHGGVHQRDPVVSTGAQATGVHIARFHRAMLAQASEAIDHFTADERDLSALTLSVPKAAIADLKARLSQFRKELLAAYGEGKRAEQVVQINIQLFPLSAAKETAKKDGRKDRSE